MVHKIIVNLCRVTSLAMHHNDTIEDDKKINVSYRISRRACPSDCVGATFRMFKTRMAEHRATVRRLNPNSKITEHVNETGHCFNFSEANILSHVEAYLEGVCEQAWLWDDQSIKRHIHLHPAYHCAMLYRLARRRDRGTERRSINLSWYEWSCEFLNCIVIIRMMESSVTPKRQVNKYVRKAIFLLIA